jgi:hypothetical protein
MRPRLVDCGTSTRAEIALRVNARESEWSVQVFVRARRRGLRGKHSRLAHFKLDDAFSGQSGDHFKTFQSATTTTVRVNSGSTDGMFELRDDSNQVITGETSPAGVTSPPRQLTRNTPAHPIRIGHQERDSILNNFVVRVVAGTNFRVLRSVENDGDIDITKGLKAHTWRESARLHVDPDVPKSVQLADWVSDLYGYVIVSRRLKAFIAEAWPANVQCVAPSALDRLRVFRNAHRLAGELKA